MYACPVIADSQEDFDVLDILGLNGSYRNQSYFLFKGPFATFNLPQADNGVELSGIKFSNDGKKILVPTTSGVVYLLDAFQGNLLHTFMVRAIEPLSSNYFISRTYSYFYNVVLTFFESWT